MVRLFFVFKQRVKLGKKFTLCDFNCIDYRFHFSGFWNNKGKLWKIHSLVFWFVFIVECILFFLISWIALSKAMCNLVRKGIITSKEGKSDKNQLYVVEYSIYMFLLVDIWILLDYKICWVVSYNLYTCFL